MSVGLAIEMDNDGDLVLQTNEGGGIDLALIEGILEVQQAIEIRLRTIRGEDPFFPLVGLPIREIIGLFNPSFIEAVVRQTILQDRRVDRVGTITIDLKRETRTATVRAEITLKTGDEIDVSVDLVG